MQDVSFGNYLYELRKSTGCVQKEVASFCGVSNKAVSKWENGITKPKVQVIRKLAELYRVSPDVLLKKMEKIKMQKISKIVLTGGPCAGKSTAMAYGFNKCINIRWVNHDRIFGVLSIATAICLVDGKSER